MIKTVTLAEPEQKKRSLWKPFLLFVSITLVGVGALVYLTA